MISCVRVQKVWREKQPDETNMICLLVRYELDPVHHCMQTAESHEFGSR